MSYPSQNPSQPQGGPQFSAASPGYGPPAPAYPPAGPGYPSQPHGHASLPPAYGPPPQQPGHYAPPAPPKKKKSKVGLIIGVIVAVLAIICGGAFACTALVANSLPDSTSGSGNGGGSGSTTVGLNQPGRDGKFEFTVNSVQCAVKHIGSSSFGHDAQGQFCLVKLTVKNIGNESQDFFGSNVYGFNADGQKFEVDTEAAIYLDDSNSLYEKINPGNTVNGTIVFDMPGGQQLRKLELHDSLFSGGVVVNL